jgi:TolA-binding protein
MKKIILKMLLLAIVVAAEAQQTSVYTHSDLLFDQAKDLYHQGKYAASYRRMEEYLKRVEHLSAGQVHDASFYIVANAFELRQDNATILIDAFLERYTNTTFADELNYMKGMLRYEEKDYVAALQFFEAVKPERLGIRNRSSYSFAQGYSFMHIEQYARASAVFRELKEDNTPFQIPATYYFAYSEYYLKNYDTALPEFQKVEHVEKFRENVTYYLFQLYYRSGDTDSLRVKADYLQKHYPDHPNNAELFRIQGEIAYNDGRFTEAIDYLKRYESATPRMLRHSSYIMGMSLIRVNRHNSAIPYFQQVTTEEDALTENAYLHLGHCFVKVRDKVNARLAFEAVLRTRFDEKVREEAMLNYALTTYETTSAFGESISAFEQFLEEFPNSKGANSVKSYLASAYMASKNYAVAYESIKKIKNPNEKIREARQFILYQLGSEAFIQNHYDKAVEYFNLSLQDRISARYTAESLYWRSESYYRLGKITNSIADLRAFMSNPEARNSKNFVMAHYSMGYSHFRNQNFREAKRYFELYMNLERNKMSDVFADALSRVGDCLFYERDFANAELFYSRAANLSRNTGDYALFQSAYVAGLQRKHSTKISRMNSLVEMYPNSSYVDNAMYETGRAYLMLNNETEALKVYHRLVASLPNSEKARIAALEIGMIHLNRNQHSEAITAYKAVIASYPGSVEAFTALETLENIYIELNDVPAYLAYAQSLNMNIAALSAGRQDSISYIAAEKQYMNTNYVQAATGFRAYLQNYCAGGRFCTSAQYYLADSYYRMKNYDQALAEFRKVINIPGNQYMEEALMRAAEISFDKKDYANALAFFRQFESVAQNWERRNIARLGVLRSAYHVGDYNIIIKEATNLLDDARSTREMINEARYLRAQSYIRSGNSGQAIADLQFIGEDTRTAWGAEATFLLAKLYFDQRNFEKAEATVQDFARKNTPHQYWLARSFVLLSDVYIAQQNDFQAKQYLLSLQRNYKAQDDVQGMIESRLASISARERARVTN